VGIERTSAEKLKLCERERYGVQTNVKQPTMPNCQRSIEYQASKSSSSKLFGQQASRANITSSKHIEYQAAEICLASGSASSGRTERLFLKPLCTRMYQPEYILVCMHMYLSIRVCTSTSTHMYWNTSHRHVCTTTYWCIQVCTSTYEYVLVCSGIYWEVK
jgi:hypothetical protein